MGGVQPSRGGGLLHTTASVQTRLNGHLQDLEADLGTRCASTNPRHVTDVLPSNGICPEYVPAELLPVRDVVRKHGLPTKRGPEKRHTYLPPEKRPCHFGKMVVVFWIFSEEGMPPPSVNRC